MEIECYRVDEVFEEIRDTYDKCGRLDYPDEGNALLINFTNGKIVGFWSGEGGDRDTQGNGQRKF